VRWWLRWVVVESGSSLPVGGGSRKGATATAVSSRVPSGRPPPPPLLLLLLLPENIRAEEPPSQQTFMGRLPEEEGKMGEPPGPPPGGSGAGHGGARLSTTAVPDGISSGPDDGEGSGDFAVSSLNRASAAGDAPANINIGQPCGGLRVPLAAGESQPGSVYVNGFAARGPGFATAAEFFQGMLSKTDMSGSLMEGKDKFDRQFFQTSAQQASFTDPQIRLLLEVTYEALVEAGVRDFTALPSSETGVYVGSSFADFHSAAMHGPGTTGYEHTGAAGAMLANSISRFFGFGGASMKIDSACSSSLQAFDVVS